MRHEGFACMRRHARGQGVPALAHAAPIRRALCVTLAFFLSFLSSADPENASSAIRQITSTTPILAAMFNRDLSRPGGLCADCNCMRRDVCPARPSFDMHAPQISFPQLLLPWFEQHRVPALFHITPHPRNALALTIQAKPYTF